MHSAQGKDLKTQDKSQQIVILGLLSCLQLSVLFISHLQKNILIEYLLGWNNALKCIIVATSAKIKWVFTSAQDTDLEVFSHCPANGSFTVRHVVGSTIMVPKVQKGPWGEGIRLQSLWPMCHKPYEAWKSTNPEISRQNPDDQSHEQMY